MEPFLREASEHASETQDEPTPDEEGDRSSVTASADASDGKGSGSRQTQEVSLNGELIDFEPDTTVGELREIAGIASEEVFTCRSPDGIEALSEGDVVANHVSDGGEIQTQPIADSEVFGAR